MPPRKRRSDSRLKSISEDEVLESPTPRKRPVLGVPAERPRSRSSQELVKPHLSLAHLIREAISESPRQRLLLHEIYDAIARRYPYYQAAGDGWKNSIRHNLSVNSMFCKIPRDILEKSEPVTEEKMREADELPGRKKGCYWVIRDQHNFDEITRHNQPRTRSASISVAAGDKKVQLGAKPKTIDITQMAPQYMPMPTFIDVGRRYSDSFLYSQIASRYPVSLGQLRTNVDALGMLQAPPQARSHYHPQASSGGEEEEPFAEIQPLAIEETNQAGPELGWWNTQPVRKMAARKELSDHQVVPDVYPVMYPALAPQLLPRRPIKDIWLGNPDSDPTNGDPSARSKYLS